jgi:hypothetical protein
MPGRPILAAKLQILEPSNSEVTVRNNFTNPKFERTSPTTPQ